jgi:hypothetical protein
MAKVERREVVQRIIDVLRLDAGREVVPGEVEGKIRAVISADPIPQIQTAIAHATDATTATIHTCSAVKQTWLSWAGLTVAKDASNDGLFSGITVTPKGSAAGVLVHIRYEPSTAGEHKGFFPYPHAIRLEEGSTVTVTNNTNTASIDASGCIGFYEVEP